MVSRVDPEAARKVFLAAGLEPLEDFPGSRTGWLSRCQTCNRKVQPHLHSVKRGTGCSHCARDASARRQQERGLRIAKEVLSTSDLQLIGDYVNAKHPISVMCLLCNRRFETTQASVKSGNVKCTCKKLPRNPLVKTHPGLYAQLHPTKNVGLDPSKVGTGMREAVWWRCLQGHEFRTSPASRVAGNGACPVCAGTAIVKGVNDLEITDPELYSELTGKKLDPMVGIHPFSNKKYFWRCLQNPKHEYEASVYSRKSGTGCPYCAGKKVLVGDNDLATTHSRLALEWHSEKNTLTPADVVAGSHRKVWWRCSADKSHEWEAIVSSRTKGHGCPVCAHQQLKVGFNDLGSLHPDVAALWHPTKNGTLRPTDVLGAPQQSYWWQCPKEKGHYWLAPANRLVSQGAGCAVCANRQILAGQNDLATIDPVLASEWAFDLNGLDPSEVSAESHKRVWWRCKKYSDHVWETTPGQRRRGHGCPVCAGRALKPGFNDLESQAPEVAREWDSGRNGNLVPSEVLVGSHKKVHWRCRKNPLHVWAASVSSRVRGNGCPVCSNQLTVAGINDFATLYPDLLSEWSMSRNRELHPTTISPGSSKKVWWTCRNHSDHHWQASIASRTRLGTACPICRNLQVKPGFNDLATKRPDVASTWHPTKNNGVTPQEVVAGTNVLFWWQCPSVPDHSWRASVKNRSKGKGCPDCTPAGYTANQPGYFYAIRNPSLKAKKVGITNSPVGTGRLSSFEKSGWQIIRVWSSDDGLVAQAAETRVLRWIRQDKFLPPYLAASEMPRTGGWSETFSDEGIPDKELVEVCQRVFDEELLRIGDQTGKQEGLALKGRQTVRRSS